jgi:uncharacterized protein
VADPRDLPLLLASDRFATDGERFPLDRVRMQKGVFLLEMRGRAEWRELFDFNPYNWGPYSRDLATAVSGLIAHDMLKSEDTGGRYRAYKTTPLGDQWLDNRVVPGLAASDLNFVRSIRTFLTARSFNDVLRDVYAAYPDYAVASQFKS